MPKLEDVTREDDATKRRARKRGCPTCDALVLIPKVPRRAITIHPCAQFLYDVRETLHMSNADDSPHAPHIRDMTVGPTSRLARFVSSVGFPFSDALKPFDVTVAMRPITYGDLSLTNCFDPGVVLSKFSFGESWSVVHPRHGDVASRRASASVAAEVTQALRKERAAGAAPDTIRLTADACERLEINPTCVVKIQDGANQTAWAPTVDVNTWVVQASPRGEFVVTHLTQGRSTGVVRFKSTFATPPAVTDAVPPKPNTVVDFVVTMLNDDMDTSLSLTPPAAPIVACGSCGSCGHAPPTVRVQEKTPSSEAVAA